VDKAKKAYEGLLKEHLQHRGGHALGDLVDIAQVEKDFKARLSTGRSLRSR